jgi:hypothetical protein
MRSILYAALLIGSLALLNAAPRATTRPAAAAGPVILKRTIHVWNYRFLRYWPNPKAAEPQYNTWSWVPRIEFEVIGAVPGGSQWVVDFQMPDGKPWVSYKCRTDELGDDEVGKVEGPVSDDDEKRAITATGVFPFKIHLKNALAGTDTVMFEGKARVGTYPPDQKIPEYKGKKEFYVDQDWRLPVAFMWLNPTFDENVPPLSVTMWFRGASNGEHLDAFLMKNGQPVATVPAGGNNMEGELKTGVGDPMGSWGRFTWTFVKVRGFNKDNSMNRYPDVFYLDKNPGEYEVRVLRNGKLARVAKFTVGADGWPNDNGVAVNNKIGGIRKIIPVQVLGDQDLGYNPLAWKTDAFYGNPLAGFTVP